MNRKTIEVVNCHALNKSKTKETHAFSRAGRFPQVKKSECNQDSYDISRSSSFKTKSQSKTQNGFGTGKRFKEEDERRKRSKMSPSPNDYEVQDFLAISRNKSPAFGKEQKMKQVKKEFLTPGPGEYLNETNQGSRISYSINGKRKSVIQPHWNKVGPGEYEVNKENPELVNSYETFNKSPSRSRYSVTPERKIKKGGYSFGRSEKRGIFDEKVLNRNNIPGPGSYESDFSQFSEGSRRILQRVLQL